MSALTSPRVLARRKARNEKRAKKRPRNPANGWRPTIRSRLEQAQFDVSSRRFATSKHRLRELLCAENDTPNTGRQWRLLRKHLSREDRAASTNQRKRAA